MPNDIDEPRLRLARLLPRRRRDSRGRWLWRLVRLRFATIKQSHPNGYNNKGDSSDTRADPNRVRLWSQSHQHAKDTDADKERGPLGESMGSFFGEHNGNGLSTPNVKDEPRHCAARRVRQQPA
jgi:hypothetical protein